MDRPGGAPEETVTLDRVIRSRVARLSREQGDSSRSSRVAGRPVGLSVAIEAAEADLRERDRGAPHPSLDPRSARPRSGKRVEITTIAFARPSSLASRPGTAKLTTGASPSRWKPRARPTPNGSPCTGRRRDFDVQPTTR